MELSCLSTLHIPRCYSPAGFSSSSMPLHGFSDASEEAYAGVVYLRVRTSKDSIGKVHIVIVT